MPKLLKDGRSYMATIVSVISFAVLVIVVLVIAAFDNDGSADKYINIMWPLLLSTIPSVFAAVKAEQTSNDIRNGLLKTKVKDALTEHATASDQPIPEESTSDTLAEYEPGKDESNG